MAYRLWVFGSLAIAAIVWGITAGALAVLPLAWIGGVLLWTVIEYLMHRYAFHGFAPHYDHHAQPKEAKYILANFSLSLPMSAGVWLLLWLATRSLVLPGMVMAGVWTGYLAYEGIHLRIHSDVRGGRLLRALRRYHYRHHFADDTVCYGVTSPLWDLVCRTR